MKRIDMRSLALGLIFALCALTAVGADKFKDGLWTSFGGTTMMKELIEGQTVYHAPAVFAAPNNDSSYLAYQELNSLASDLNIIVIDMSDTTGYPHPPADFVFFDDVSGKLCLTDAGGTWYAKFGVITRISDTYGSVSYFYSGYLQGATNTCTELTYRPLNTTSTELDGATPTKFTTGIADTDSTGWQADTALATFIGGSTCPEKGDIVVSLRLIGGSAKLDGHGFRIRYHVYPQ